MMKRREPTPEDFATSALRRSCLHDTILALGSDMALLVVYNHKEGTLDVTTMGRLEKESALAKAWTRLAYRVDSDARHTVNAFRDESPINQKAELVPRTDQN